MGDDSILLLLLTWCFQKTVQPSHMAAERLMGFCFPQCGSRQFCTSIHHCFLHHRFFWLWRLHEDHRFTENPELEGTLQIQLLSPERNTQNSKMVNPSKVECEFRVANVWTVICCANPCTRSIEQAVCHQGHLATRFSSCPVSWGSNSADWTIQSGLWLVKSASVNYSPSFPACELISLCHLCK